MWIDLVWIIHVLEVLFFFFLTFGYVDYNFIWAFPPCVLVLYEELISSSGRFKKQHSALSR